MKIRGEEFFEDNCKNEEKFSCEALKNIDNTGSDGAISIAE